MWVIEIIWMLLQFGMTMGIILILAICGIGILTKVMQVIVCLLTGDFSERQQKLRLKFSDFEKYYAINPSRYKIEQWSAWVLFHKEDALLPTRKYEIRFGPIDYVRFLIWKSAHQDTDLMESYLESVQEDIANKRAEAERRRMEAVELLCQVHIREEELKWPKEN